MPTYNESAIGVPALIRWMQTLPPKARVWADDALYDEAFAWMAAQARFAAYVGDVGAIRVRDVVCQPRRRKPWRVYVQEYGRWVEVRALGRHLEDRWTGRRYEYAYIDPVHRRAVTR